MRSSGRVASRKTHRKLKPIIGTGRITFNAAVPKMEPKACLRTQNADQAIASRREEQDIEKQQYYPNGLLAWGTRAAPNSLTSSERRVTMTYDPYHDGGLRLYLPNPNRGGAGSAEETQATIWLPIAIAIALLIGVAYYFYGHAWNAGSQVRADNGAVTKSEPSPNDRIRISSISRGTPQLRGFFFSTASRRRR